jgi:hypothetical protein
MALTVLAATSQERHDSLNTRIVDEMMYRSYVVAG